MEKSMTNRLCDQFKLVYQTQRTRGKYGETSCYDCRDWLLLSALYMVDCCFRNTKRNYWLDRKFTIWKGILGPIGRSRPEKVILGPKGRSSPANMSWPEMTFSSQKVRFRLKRAFEVQKGIRGPKRVFMKQKGILSWKGSLNLKGYGSKWYYSPKLYNYKPKRVFLDRKGTCGSKWAFIEHHIDDGLLQTAVDVTWVVFLSIASKDMWN